MLTHAENQYVYLPIDQIELDKTNPRIANFVERYTEESLTSENMALLLGTSTDACASLRESIKENGGIINPIVVSHKSDGRYIVIEGNTRLQIYKDFVKKNEPGNWTQIRAIVYEDLQDEEMHAIRLQAHLVGPREWDSYSKAKYLNYLANEKHMPIRELINFCGGNSKQYEIKHMIQAYRDMHEYYKPLCEDDSQFDIKKFQGFVELQSGTIQEALKMHGYGKTDFAKWIFEGHFSKLADIRRLPNILNSKKARDSFLRFDSSSAKKILAVEEISSDTLKDVPYELLAKELSKRMDEFGIKEVIYLRTDPEYESKLVALKNVIADIQMILDEVEGV